MIDRQGKLWSRPFSVLGLCGALWLSGCGSDGGTSDPDTNDGSAGDGDGTDGTPADGDPRPGDGASEDGSGGDGAPGDGAPGDGDGDGDGDGSDLPALPFAENGISASVDGTVLTYTNVNLVPNFNYPDLLQFSARSEDVLKTWKLHVPNTPGRYDCTEEVEGGALIQLIDGSGGGPTGTSTGTGSCAIELITAADGVYYGTFTAELETGTGTPLQVIDGVFYYSQYSRPNGTGALGAGETGVTFQVGGDWWKYETAYYLAGPDDYAGVSAVPGDLASPGSPIGIQLHTLPNATGSYTCGEGPAYRAVNVWFYWKGAYLKAGNRQAESGAGPVGSSCSIEIDEIGAVVGTGYEGTLGGSFSGTFVSDDGTKSVTVTNGSFRYSSP